MKFSTDNEGCRGRAIIEANVARTTQPHTCTFTQAEYDAMRFKKVLREKCRHSTRGAREIYTEVTNDIHDALKALHPFEECQRIMNGAKNEQ